MLPGVKAEAPPGFAAPAGRMVTGRLNPVSNLQNKAQAHMKG